MAEEDKQYTIKSCVIANYKWYVQMIRLITKFTNKISIH